MLSAFQERIARLFLRMPEASNFALAGGAALIVAQVVERETRDLDFFAPVVEEISAAVESFKKALREEGLEYEVVRSSPAFARMVVTDTNSGERVLVDIGHDYRLRKPVLTSVGPALNVEELAADKLLALFGRAEARDFVDVYYLSGRVGINVMLALAREKDPGLDRHVLATMLGRFEQLPRLDYQVDDPTYEKMRLFFQGLQAQLIDECLGD